MDVVFADIWITTGGTKKNKLTRCFGEAVNKCVNVPRESESRDKQAAKKPVVIGFSKLRSLDEIRKQSQTTDDKQVRFLDACARNPSQL